MPAEVRPGEVLAGKYAIEHVLGRGGMGIVLAARHLQLDERVAIKLMLPDVATNAEAVSRFVREARAAAKIRSEHVVRVSDVGTLEGGQPYMVMEHLDGSDLSSLVHARGRLPVEEVAEYVLQACEAISEAHSLGIVHRDLKPSNLFLTRRVDGTPVVKVLDFGISKVLDATGTLTAGTPARTQTSALMGSPLYMSPEQMASSRDVDARSDIWALGVIIYELLAGTPPFTGQTLPEVCARILEGAAPPLRERVQGVPAEVEALVARCLVRELAARFQDVGELGRALVPFAPKRARVSVDRISAVLGTTATYLHVPSSADPRVAPAPSGGTEATWAESKHPVRSKTSRVFAAGVGVVTLAGVAAFVIFGRRADDHPASATAMPREMTPAAQTSAPLQPPPAVEPDPVPAPPSPPVAAVVAVPAVSSSPLHPPRSAPAPKPVTTPARPATSPKVAVPAANATVAPSAKATLTLGGRL